jgi:hypothetical protein
MHVRVTDVSFTIDQPWIFKFRDSTETEYLAFDTEFYIEHGLTFPINRMHIDQLDVGMSSKISFTVISGENIVTSIS